MCSKQIFSNPCSQDSEGQHLPTMMVVLLGIVLPSLSGEVMTTEVEDSEAEDTEAED